MIEAMIFRARSGYRFCHRLENFFQRMQCFRGITSRYDKSCLHFMSAVQLIAVLDWICFRVWRHVLN